MMGFILTAMQITNLSQDIFNQNLNVGWWTQEEVDKIRNNYDEGTRKFDKESTTLLAAKLALVHSEVSEALEGLRKGLLDDHLPARLMFEVELADTIIRILDIAGACDLDIGNAVLEKLSYNRERADHKMENRLAEGGKTI